MKTKNETNLLKELIITTRNKRANELVSLREELHEVCESLRPINLIKNIFNEVTHSPEIKNNLTDGVVGLGTGFLVEKLVTGNPKTFGKKMLGNIIQFGVANFVAKHFDEIKAITKHLYDKVSESGIFKKA